MAEIPGAQRPGETRRWKPSPGRLARTRLEVFNRDDWACQSCGREMPPRTPEESSGRRAPMYGWDFLELDHLVPYSEGGVFIAENLRAACSPCNRRRGASPLDTTGGE